MSSFEGSENTIFNFHYYYKSYYQWGPTTVRGERQLSSEHSKSHQKKLFFIGVSIPIIQIHILYL